jgi:phage repressor protein C with HTH and peptisase S24 domain
MPYENEIASRIREIRRQKGLSVVEFAVAIGEKAHRITDIEREKQRAPMDVLKKIAEYFQVNPLWLFDGIGPIFKTEGEEAFAKNMDILEQATQAVTSLPISEAQKSWVRDILFAVNSGKSDFVKQLLDMPAPIPLEKIGEEDGFIMVPRYDVRASAGSGALIQSELIVDYLAFRQEWVSKMGLIRQQLALIEVHGDSMEPSLFNNDLVLIDLRTAELSADGIYVIQHGGHLLVKRIQSKLDGTIIVMSDNLKYQPQVLTSEESKNLIVVGRVVWFGRAM